MNTTEIKPIFVDRCCGLHDYSFLKTDEILVHSIFKTIQGEGPYSGQIATFIRLAGCNFGGKSEPIKKDSNGKIIQGGGGCSFCDTRFYYHEGKVYKIKDLVSEIKSKYFTKEDLQHNPLVIITGGEPTLQLTLVNLIKELNTNEINTQIETNGTFLKLIFNKGYPQSEVLINNKRLYNTVVCSPKLGSAIKYNEKQFDQETLKRIDHLKFVVEDPEENKETPYSSLPSYINIFKKYHPVDHIWVSGINVYKRPTSIAEGEAPCLFQSVPCVEGYNKEKGPLFDLNSCYKNYKYAAKLAMQNGYRLNFQLHLLFGLF